MKELAEWLIQIEDLAGQLYGNAARSLGSDKELSRFLSHMAEEEKHHSVVMAQIADHLGRNSDLTAAIKLDDITRDRIEGPFLDCGSRLGSDTLSREHIINCVVSAEYSEWNDIFVYVMNTLKDAGREFGFTAATMQAHKAYVESYLATLPESEVYLRTMRRLPPIWRPRILVVEDHEGVRDFLTAVLSMEGEVDTAGNGREALDRVRAMHYDAVVSDVDMPVMNGIAFFRAASRFAPRLGERFLFLTGNPTDETLAFVREHNLRCLQKPMPIDELEKEVKKLLDRRQQ